MNSAHVGVADEIEAMLRQLPPEIARKVGDRAVLAGARVIAREMKMRAPVGKKAELVLKRMRAWKLDRQISLYTVSKTQSVSGDWVPTEVVFATVAAEIRPVPGLDGAGCERDQARPQKVFRICWRSGVTNKYLLRFENIVYDIARIDEVGHREGLDITAIAKVS
jgi:head-tail adaptor